MDWLKQRVSGWIKENVPSNVRLLTSTALGDRTPVTENYFPEKDLAAMRTAATRGIARQKKSAAALSESADYWRRLDPKAPASYALGTGPNGELLRENIITVGETAGQIQKRADRAAKAHGSVQYENYPDQAQRDLDRTGWVDSAISSVTDPAYRVMTTVGRANLEKDAAGNTILKDEYSFHGGGHGKPGTPTDVLDAGMNLVVPKGAGRAVRINLGKLESPDAAPGFGAKAVKK